MTRIALADARTRIAGLELPADANAIVVGREASNLLAAALMAGERDVDVLTYAVEDGLAVCDDLSPGLRIAILAPSGHHKALELLIERAGASLAGVLALERG